WIIRYTVVTNPYPHVIVIKSLLDNACKPNGLKINRKKKINTPKATEPIIFITTFKSRGCGLLIISRSLLKNIIE
ncbi:hypothetical protein ACFLTI_09910, partial [Bacteroidota bacterium]